MEAKGLVLAEAMAAGSPVVALDASGVREVVRDGENGLLLPADAGADVFGKSLHDALARRDRLARWSEAAVATADGLDRAKTSARLLALYAELIDARRAETENDSALKRALKPVAERIATEGRIIADKTGALLDAVNGHAPDVSAAAPATTAA